MRTILALAVGASALLTLSYATAKGDWTWANKPFKGSYSIYSGSLGEEAAPTSADRKLSIAVSGQLAKEMFESMYPDFKPTCNAEKGDRDRRKGNLYCTYHPGEGYRCFIGIDLRTGNSIAGGTC